MLTHISFGKGKKTLAILIPTKDLNHDLIFEHYIKPLTLLGLDPGSIIAFNLEQNAKNKSPVTLIKSWLKTLRRSIDSLEIKNLLVCDSSYFKTICKVTKSEPHYGYAMPTGWTDVNAFISLNYRALFFNPAAQSKIDLSLRSVVNHLDGFKTLTVDKIMTTNLIVATKGDDIDYIHAVMTENRVRHIPILADNELKGLVSIGHVVKSQLKEKNVENKYLKAYMADKYPG